MRTQFMSAVETRTVPSEPAGQRSWRAQGDDVVLLPEITRFDVEALENPDAFHWPGYFWPNLTLRPAGARIRSSSASRSRQRSRHPVNEAVLAACLRLWGQSSKRSAPNQPNASTSIRSSSLSSPTSRSSRIVLGVLR